MTPLRELIRRYPVAAIAAVVAALVLGGWTVYQSRVPQQGASVPPPQPPRIAAPPPIAPPAGTAVTPTAPTGPAGSTVVTPTFGATPPETTGEGRPNPFEPLTGPPGPVPAPSGPAIPPVPPLQPGGPAGQGTAPQAPPAPPAPQYRLVGFVWGDTAFAILEDGRGTYIVGPGDTVTAGTKVVAIDVRREVVWLDRDGTSVALTFAGPARPAP
jgi:hypothetical protein